MSETEIVDMLINGQNDVELFNSNFHNFKSKYNNMFLAYANQEVIDFDPVLSNLINKLKNKGIEISNVFIEFVSDAKFIL